MKIQSLLFAIDSIAVGIARWKDLQNLYGHLHSAKKMEAEVSRDLRAVLQQLNSICEPINNISGLPQNVASSALTGKMEQLDLHISLICVYV